MTGFIKQALDNHVNSGRKKFSHDRSQTAGGSEIGQCVRKIFWLKSEGDPVHGVARDPEYTDSWGARIRGTVFEDAFWEPALRASYGIRLKFAGKQQRTFTNGFLSATPDGLIVELTEKEKAEIGTKADCVNVECKTADPRTNLAEAKSANVFQVQVQMGLVRDNTPYKPTHCILSYTDASFWSEVKEFVIAFDPKIYQIAKQRAMLIMTATDVAEVKPEGWIAGGKECNYCPFTKACGIERRNLPFQDEDVDPQFAAEMRELAITYRDLEQFSEKADAALRQTQVVIKSRLRAKGVRKIPGVLNWSQVKARGSYDAKAIREAAIAAGIDVEQFATVGEPSDRLAILIGSSEDEPVPGPVTAAV
jgi:hypothetical protein